MIDVAVDDVLNSSNRLSFNPIVRSHWGRHSNHPQAHRPNLVSTHYSLCERDDAEVAVLPRLYEATDAAVFRSAISRAEAFGLRTLVFGGHDLEPIMPSPSVILLHPGPTRNAQPHADVLALPYIFTDRTRPPENRPDGSRPSVAFCGQGAVRRGAGLVQSTRRTAQVLANRVRPRVVPTPITSPVTTRSRAMKALHSHDGVDTNFIIRNQYRAGASGEADRTRTQAEFDDNLRTSTYALCVRGTGNFSARFYEALSFGRVPLFVDTDCVLPFEDEIDWKSRTVWVPADELSSIGERLVAEHPHVLTDHGRSQPALRKLWEDRLTQEGFYAHLPEAVRRLL